LSYWGMNASKLCDFDANLYRLYAVGLVSYEDALAQAQSVSQLRRAMLGFDQNARSVTPLAGVNTPLPKWTSGPPPAQA